MDNSRSDFIHHISNEVVLVSQAVWILLSWKTVKNIYTHIYMNTKFLLKEFLDYRYIHPWMEIIQLVNLTLGYFTAMYLWPYLPLNN